MTVQQTLGAKDEDLETNEAGGRRKKAGKNGKAVNPAERYS